jgi:hypothetical protein
MQWIKILSSQTLHCAMSLQFLVEEMVRYQQGKPMKV